VEGKGLGEISTPQGSEGEPSGGGKGDENGRGRLNLGRKFGNLEIPVSSAGWKKINEGWHVFRWLS